jgi:dolichol-phosphate mannosyltransferase
VHDEERTIGALVRDLEHDVLAVVPSAQVIVVDDASTDGTPQLLADLQQSRPWLHVKRLDVNVGHGRAVRQGLDSSRGDWIFGLDSDGQFVVADFALLWARRDEAELVLGVRQRRHDPRHRLVLSQLVARVSSLLARRRLKDANTPFRLLRRDAWEDLSPTLEATALAPNVLMTVGAGLRGWRILELPVRHLPRSGTPSTLRALRLVRFSLRGLAQLIVYRRRVCR